MRQILILIQAAGCHNTENKEIFDGMNNRPIAVQMPDWETASVLLDEITLMSQLGFCTAVVYATIVDDLSVFVQAVFVALTRVSNDNSITICLKPVLFHIFPQISIKQYPRIILISQPAGLSKSARKMEFHHNQNSSGSLICIDAYMHPGNE